MLNRILILVVFAVVMQCSTYASVVVNGVIGDTDVSITALDISVKGVYICNIPSGTKLIRVREVYPDSAPQPRYQYSLYVGKHIIYKRDYIGKGFGTVSCFVSIPEIYANSKSIKLKNDGDAPIKIAGMNAVNPSELAEIEKSDSFGLFGLITAYGGANDEAKWVKALADGLPKASGIYRGFSTEIPYAAWGDDTLKSLIKRHIGYASTYDLAYLPSFVSWWAATPRNITDGKGGKFDDIKYQQICWSPDDNTDEGPAFRALMGDRWNMHYGLTIPNEWSDTPWLTMNSPDLNKYRYNKLDWILKEFFNTASKSKADIKGIYLENEPRYWDTACEASNNKRNWKTCWADFNPFVIADAKRDGVDIDPSNGLDNTERLWLHRNVARYNQDVVDQARATMKSIGINSSMSVYPHSLQLLGFPGDEIGHTMSEWAYVKGGYTGLEAIWTKLSDFDRVREWGPWTNLNREEGDGREIAEHLWDLRVTYAKGGNLYNSYNWNNIGAERVFAYMKEFLDNLPSVKSANPLFVKTGVDAATFKISGDIQGLNQITAQIKSMNSFDGSIEASVYNSKGFLIGYAQSYSPLTSGSNDVVFNFAEAFELAQNETGTIRISQIGGASINGVDLQNAEFSFNMKRERMQSLYIIKHAAKR